jgi:hypothetical protein
MAITIDDFSKIWASTSPLTPYEFSENNYKQGWNFVGGTPPSRQMWDFLQKQNDEKLKYLLDNFDDYLPLSGGTMTGNINYIGTDDRNFGVSFTSTSADFGWNNENADGSFIGFRSSSYGDNQSGDFLIRAKNSSDSKELRGKPDGTLTWGGKTVIVGTEATETFNNISIGENGGYNSVTLSHAPKYVSFFVGGSNTQKVIPHMLGATSVYLVNLHTSAVTASLTVNYIY